MFLQSPQRQAPRGHVRAPPPSTPHPRKSLPCKALSHPRALFPHLQRAPPLSVHPRPALSFPVPQRPAPASPYHSLALSFPAPAAQVEVDGRWGRFPSLMISLLWYPRPNQEPAFLYPRSHLFSIEMAMITNTLGVLSMDRHHIYT